ncbi:hypothetical protein [Rhizobium leguminosarum]|uniref:hypothetical protein n=1 Tax=Rhizobium leguminosarum TaxID=384 RepID=UPI003D02ADF3
MLEFWVSDLQHGEEYFTVPGVSGTWTFTRRSNYHDLVGQTERGQVVATFYVSNPDFSLETDDQQSIDLSDDLVDICLVLSFLKAHCVTVTGTTLGSRGMLMQLDERHLAARSIVGFDRLWNPDFSGLFADWQTVIRPAYRQRGLRLQLSHWLSGLTCFTLEDLYLSAGVQMDMVKQQEIAAGGGPGLTYFQGMQSASTRYGIIPLSHDATKMRNDLLHEGKLSGANFQSKTKRECAQVIADTMTWLDTYVLKILGFEDKLHGLPRWKVGALEHGLPSISIR